MTRADALRDLIARVEAGDDDIAAGGASAKVFDPAGYASVCTALNGSLDAVARLEAPLLPKGWDCTVKKAREDFCTVWWWPPGVRRINPRCIASAPTEARARLLAVLRALAFEADAAEPRAP